MIGAVAYIHYTKYQDAHGYDGRLAINSDKFKNAQRYVLRSTTVPYEW